MRLIDADRLETVMSETIMVIIRNPKMDNQEAHVMAAFDAFGKMLHNAPIIDAVPVVRCKDCKYSTKEQIGYGCENFSRLATNGKFYCSLGERKDNAAD